MICLIAYAELTAARQGKNYIALDVLYNHYDSTVSCYKLKEWIAIKRKGKEINKKDEKAIPWIMK